MSWGKDHIEASQWRQPLKGHNRDEGYAERYHDTVTRSSSFWIHLFLKALLGFFALLILTGALLTGWIREAIIGLIGLLIVVGLFSYIQKVKNRRQQQRLYEEHAERRNGIENRFGRSVAGRKKN